jgi:DNA-directed RNA polymerase subunit RPC12/RpoP
MSEFKYACPVCGQHIKCDSSQSGTQMECPTCFQKIIVPQAPTAEQKFILTGTKVGGERPLPKGLEAVSSAFPKKTFPGVAAVLIILFFIGAAVGFVYRGTIFKPGTPPVTQPPPSPSTPVVATPQPTLPPKTPSPPLPAPPANDTNWTLNLNGITIPDSTVAGRINGQDFICQHATFTGDYLSLRNGDLGLSIGFGGATVASLAGKSLNVTTNTPSAARISLRWRDGDQIMHKSFTNDYAMLLDFGAFANNRISGKIYLCMSDKNQSYVAGTFNAEVRKPKPRTQ